MSLTTDAQDGVKGTSLPEGGGQGAWYLEKACADPCLNQDSPARLPAPQPCWSVCRGAKGARGTVGWQPSLHTVTAVLRAAPDKQQPPISGRFCQHSGQSQLSGLLSASRPVGMRGAARPPLDGLQRHERRVSLLPWPLTHTAVPAQANGAGAHEGQQLSSVAEPDFQSLFWMISIAHVLGHPHADAGELPMADQGPCSWTAKQGVTDPAQRSPLLGLDAGGQGAVKA